MASQADKFNAGDMTRGIDNDTPDFTPSFILTDDTKNISTGLNKGIGPRYGMSPIPGHSNADISSASVSKGLNASVPNFGGSETADDVAYYRKCFWGIVPLAVGSYDDLTVKGRMFVWLLVNTDNPATYANTWFNPSPSCHSNYSGSPNIFKYQFDLAYGFAPNVYKIPDQTTGGHGRHISPICRRINGPWQTFSVTSVTAEDILQSYLGVDSGLFYASHASIAVSGKSYNQHWLAGVNVSDGDATNTAEANFVIGELSGNKFYTLGINPGWNLAKYKHSSRDLKFWNLDANGQMIRAYIYPDYVVDENTYVATFNQDTATSNLNLTTAGTGIAVKRTYTPTYSDVTTVLLNDSNLVCDSSYRAVLVAAKKPLAFIAQDWERDTTGYNLQMTPLRNNRNNVKVYATGDDSGAGSYYSENGDRKSTCFASWPIFQDGTPLVDESTLGYAAPVRDVALGAANTGVLRANKIYEFTFALFDKQTGVETNVGEPVKFQTGSNDYVRISLFRDGQTAGNWGQTSPGFNGVVAHFFWKASYTDGLQRHSLSVNFTEIRFYYRVLGSYEWLPALFIDAAKYFYYPDHQVLWACEGAIAGLPGGQPGGFIDHSEIPDDEYESVLTYKNRAFWFSKNNMVFSSRNNIFEYPLRNSAAAPTGGYRGGIVHTFRGQSEQESRLVIFGGEETYIGRFTGDKTTMPIVVSPDTVGNYEVDGSDFNIEQWTSVTAFSYRSAVVADGILYWWGEQGIYMDDGVGTPNKLSKHLESEIFDYYDPALTDEIHAVYDEHTKEIIWFYPPLSDNTVTHALVMNTETNEFFPFEFDCKVDWAQRINTGNQTVTQKTNNLRTVVGVRKDSSEDVQYGYFLDRFNRSGDYRPETEMLVKTVAAGATSNQKILTLDSGYNSTNFATLIAGDLIAFQQFKKYTGQSTGDDLIAKIVSTNAGSDQITIQIPDGATLPNVAISDSRNYAPIWSDRLNGISWEIRSKYWMPSGVNYHAFWEHLYMFLKYIGWKRIDPNTFNAAYRSPQSEDFISDVIEMVDNSDGNFQVYHPMREVYLNNQGQALKLKLSGVHIGDEWVLQYLELHGHLEGGNLLQQFEG